MIILNFCIILENYILQLIFFFVWAYFDIVVPGAVADGMTVILLL